MGLSKFLIFRSLSLSHMQNEDSVTYLNRLYPAYQCSATEQSSPAAEPMNYILLQARQQVLSALEADAGGSL